MQIVLIIKCTGCSLHIVFFRFFNIFRDLVASLCVLVCMRQFPQCQCLCAGPQGGRSVNRTSGRVQKMTTFSQYLIFHWLHKAFYGKRFVTEMLPHVKSKIYLRAGFITSVKHHHYDIHTYIRASSITARCF